MRFQRARVVYLELSTKSQVLFVAANMWLRWHMLVSAAVILAEGVQKCIGEGVVVVIVMVSNGRLYV